jgi:hypothetical protein
MLLRLLFEPQDGEASRRRDARNILAAAHWRTLDIASLAAAANAGNSAEFGVTMIEGVEKVRFTARSA